MDTNTNNLSTIAVYIGATIGLGVTVFASFLAGAYVFSAITTFLFGTMFAETVKSCKEYLR